MEYVSNNTNRPIDIISGTESAYIRGKQTWCAGGSPWSGPLHIKPRGCDEVGCEIRCTEPCDANECECDDNKKSLGTESSDKRKGMPVYSGVLKYFPDAIREVSKCSQAGNDQHHSSKPLHWDRSKSGDELDALSRHLLEAGTCDTDGILHSSKVAWRALANLQKELEMRGNAPLSEYNQRNES
jgi:hypothetical protein